MFRLRDSRGSQGLYCGPEGLYLGSAPLIECCNGSYQLRPENEIATLLGAAYGPACDPAERLPGLRRVAEALQHRNIAEAMITALHLRLDEISENSIERLIKAEALLKNNFNADQPRDQRGRWTTEGSSSHSPTVADHPALAPAREALPVRPGGSNETPRQVAQNAPLDFSTHAWARMQQRGITPDRVIDAIKNGSRVTQPNGNIRCTGAGCVVVIDPSGRIVTIY